MSLKKALGIVLVTQLVLLVIPITVSAGGPPGYTFVGKTFDFDEYNWKGRASVEGTNNDDGLVITNLRYNSRDPIVGYFKVLRMMNAPYFIYDHRTHDDFQYKEENLKGGTWDQGIYYYDGGWWFELYVRYVIRIEDHPSVDDNLFIVDIYAQFFDYGDMSYQIHFQGLDTSQFVDLPIFVDWSIDVQGGDLYATYGGWWDTETNETLKSNDPPFDPDQSHKPVYTNGAKVKVYDNVFTDPQNGLYNVNAYIGAQTPSEFGFGDFYGLLDDNDGKQDDVWELDPGYLWQDDDSIFMADIVTFYYQQVEADSYNDYLTSIQSFKLIHGWIPFP